MFILALIGSYSIAIAVIIGFIRFKRIHKSYKPFIFICTLSLLNELIGLVLIYTIRSTSVSFNVYGLVEGLLFLRLFKGWGHFSKRRYGFAVTCAFLCAAWITDNIIVHSIKQDNYSYWIVYSFMLIFLAIDDINYNVMTNRGTLLKDSRFLICMGIIIFYSFWVTLEVFYLFQLNFSERFYLNVYMVLEAVNFLINVVFALAVLWAPKKLKFILPF